MISRIEAYRYRCFQKLNLEIGQFHVFAGSIPHFDEAGISTVLMPLFDEDTFNQIAKDVLWAVDARDRALANEQIAKKLVEEAIDNMVGN